MFRYGFALTLCLGFLIGCSSNKIAEKRSEPLTTAATAIPVGDYSLQRPIYAGSVALVPISLNKPVERPNEDFITLTEARKQNLVSITESEGREDVESLTVTNNSTAPLLLLGGDLLLGGNQDRIVARDTIIAPGKTVSVNVFCVEHGRWDDQGKEFEYQDTVVPNDVRQAAAHDGQEAVWARVDGYNSANGIVGSSLSVSRGIGTEKVQKAVAKNEPIVEESLKLQPNVVGFIYMKGGKLLSMDLFGSPKLFAKGKSSLIKGILADGAATSTQRENKADMNKCRKFLELILSENVATKKPTSSTEGQAYQTGFVRGVNLGGKPTDTGFIHGNYSPR